MDLIEQLMAGLPLPRLARFVAAAGAFLPAAALAADLTPRPVPAFVEAPPPMWVVTLSANVQAMPQYPGSKDYTGIVYPSGSIRRLGEPKRFSAPDDGISFALYDSPSLRIGPTARILTGRYFGDNRKALFGFKDVRWSVEPGIFVEFWPIPILRARGELRHGVFGHHGLVGTVALDYVQPVDRFVLSLGPRFNFGDESFARRYFGVTPDEAALNGLVTPYRPDTYVTVGALAALTYTFNEQWSATGYASYNRIVADAGASPLVRGRFGTPDQFIFGTRVDYSFTMPAPF
ncbi:MipA/OmpV family protein [Methylobacterium sp. WSM2598]|uniref:MipA/OmpV family protein n=1 Tax=Methylobacterium sp. WSM2598 TaxID=398261 RepID=UPI00036010FB|nr:MipA/OmpV family protein [Methylobacterium sp. WSM2598]